MVHVLAGSVKVYYTVLSILCVFEISHNKYIYILTSGTVLIPGDALDVWA